MKLHSLVLKGGTSRGGLRSASLHAAPRGRVKDPAGGRNRLDKAVVAVIKRELQTRSAVDVAAEFGLDHQRVAAIRDEVNYKWVKAAS